MLIKYRLHKTDNNVNGVPDFTRLRGITKRMCEDKNVTPTDALCEHFEKILATRYHELQKEGGVCVGMVCEWSWIYLVTHDPARAPNQMAARMHQGHANLTFFKRIYKAKPDGDGEAAKIAEKKMFNHHGMTLSEVRSKMLPDNSKGFGAVATEVSNMLDSEVPFMLSVPPMSGGRHALGLMEHQAVYYVLEPNEGLFRFPNKAVFEENLTNHFIQKLRPGSEWKLKSISI